MLGTWHGAEVPTGHPLDGMLEASGWWGKQFSDSESGAPAAVPDRATAPGCGRSIRCPPSPAW